MRVKSCIHHSCCILFIDFSVRLCLPVRLCMYSIAHVDDLCESPSWVVCESRALLLQIDVDVNLYDLNHTFRYYLLTHTHTHTTTHYYTPHHTTHRGQVHRPAAFHFTASFSISIPRQLASYAALSFNGNRLPLSEFSFSVSNWIFLQLDAFNNSM